MVSCASSCTLIFTILPFIFLALSLSLRQKSSGPERGSNTGCMFGTQQEVGTNLIKFRLTQTCPDASPKVLKIQEVLNLWQENTQFVDFFNQVLQEVPFQAYFWETPSVTFSTLQNSFEFIVQNAKGLANVRAEYSPFSQYLSPHENTNTVMTFPNLGKDAMLVVPCKNGNPDDYASIATFVRNAPKEQVHELWKAVGQTALVEISKEQGPIWVSTAGSGVYWLHVRLGTSPKYYTYAPYRKRVV